VKIADCPAATDELGGVAAIVKSKLWLDNAVKFTAAECVVDAESAPTPIMLKL